MIALEPTPRERAAVIGLLAVPCFVEAAAVAAGSPLRAAVGGLVQLAAWAVVVPASFLALDRLLRPPARPLGHRVAGILAIGGLAGVVQGILTIAFGAVASGVVDGLPADLTGSNGLRAAIVRAMGQSLVYLFVPYLALRRFHQFRRREREAWERDQAVRIAQLRALSAELQPHFLFNTLNAIAGMVRSDPRNAETMLIRLSDLLRLTLGLAGARESSLDKEIARLEHYVALQRMRFGPRLTVTIDVPTDVRAAAVPGLLLQPLVENALAHGINPKDGPGSIVVTARRRDDRLVLTVSDDGVGLPPPDARRERIGLSNTRARLAARFAGAARFDLAPQPAGGTIATIDVPFQEAANDASDHR